MSIDTFLARLLISKKNLLETVELSGLSHDTLNIYILS